MCMAFILQECQWVEETLNSLSPELWPQELMSPWEHSNQWISCGSLGEEGAGTLQRVSRMTVYPVKFNAFSLATVKKLDYLILEGRLKLGKSSQGFFSDGFNWASTYERLRTEFWASILKQLSTLLLYPSKPWVQGSEESWLKQPLEFTSSLQWQSLPLLSLTRHPSTQEASVLIRLGC